MNKRSERPAFLASILAVIEKEQGQITPDIVVAAARDEAHPLHGEFEWRDDVAAIQWRREQAREIIRTARLVVEVHDVAYDAGYVRNPLAQAHVQGYVRADTLDVTSAEEAIATELRQAGGLLRRAADLAKISGSAAFEQVNQLLDNIGSLATMLSKNRVESDAA